MTVQVKIPPEFGCISYGEGRKALSQLIQQTGKGKTRIMRSRRIISKLLLEQEKEERKKETAEIMKKCKPWGRKKTVVEQLIMCGGDDKHWREGGLVTIISYTVTQFFQSPPRTYIVYFFSFDIISFIFLVYFSFLRNSLLRLDRLECWFHTTTKQKRSLSHTSLRLLLIQ
jgi:hypothetical protein